MSNAFKSRYSPHKEPQVIPQRESLRLFRLLTAYPVYMDDEPWDQEDEHQRADFEHLLARMLQDHEDRSLEAAELALSRVAGGEVPMPETAHPALERYAETVRSTTLTGPIRLPAVRSIAATFTAAEEEPYPVSASLPTLTLERRKCAGPAPFVGDPRYDLAMYFWPVWTDEYGRHIAGEATLAWR